MHSRVISLSLRTRTECRDRRHWKKIAYNGWSAWRHHKYVCTQRLFYWLRRRMGEELSSNFSLFLDSPKFNPSQNPISPYSLLGYLENLSSSLRPCRSALRTTRQCAAKGVVSKCYISEVAYSFTSPTAKTRYSQAEAASLVLGKKLISVTI